MSAAAASGVLPATPAASADLEVGARNASAGAAADDDADAREEQPGRGLKDGRARRCRCSPCAWLLSTCGCIGCCLLVVSALLVVVALGRVVKAKALGAQEELARSERRKRPWSTPAPTPMLIHQCCLWGTTCHQCQFGDEFVGPGSCLSLRRCKPEAAPPTQAPTAGPPSAGDCCEPHSTCDSCPFGDESVFFLACLSSRRCAASATETPTAAPTLPPTSAPTVGPHDCCAEGSSCNSCEFGDEAVGFFTCLTSRRCRSNVTEVPTPAPTKGPGECCDPGSSCGSCPYGQESVFFLTCLSSHRCKKQSTEVATGEDASSSALTTSTSAAPGDAEIRNASVLSADDCCVPGSTCGLCPDGDELVSASTCNASRRCRRHATEVPTAAPTSAAKLAPGACCDPGTSCRGCEYGDEPVFFLACISSRRCAASATQTPTAAPTLPPTPAPTVGPHDCCSEGSSCDSCEFGDEAVGFFTCLTSRRCRSNLTEVPTPAPTKGPGECCDLGSSCGSCPYGQESVFFLTCLSSHRCREQATEADASAAPTPAPTVLLAAPTPAPTAMTTSEPTADATPAPTMLPTSSPVEAVQTSSAPAPVPASLPVLAFSSTAAPPTPVPTAAPATTTVLVANSEMPTRAPTVPPSLPQLGCCEPSSSCRTCQYGDEFVLPWTCVSTRRCRSRGNTMVPTAAPTSAPTLKSQDCCLWGFSCNNCPSGDEFVWVGTCASSRRCT